MNFPKHLPQSRFFLIFLIVLPVLFGLLSTNNSLAQTHSIIDVLEMKDQPLQEAFQSITAKTGLIITTRENLEGNITLYLRDVDALDALRIILETRDLAYEKVKDDQGREQINVITAKAFEEKYGFPFTGEIKTRMMTLQYANPDEAKTILENIKSPAGKIILNSAPQHKPSQFIVMDTPERLDQMSGIIKDMDIPVEIKTFDLRYLPAHSMAQDLRDKLTVSVGRLDFTDDPHQLIVTETPVHMPTIASLIQELDQPNREVLIETKTLQIILNDEHLQGVDWEAIVSDFQNCPVGGKELVLGTISEEDYMVLLDALNTVGITATIANRRLTANDEEAISLLVRPIKVFREPELEVRKADVNSRNADHHGLKLLLTPKIEDKMFRMKIHPELIESEGQDNDHSSTAVIELEEGSTIVVGGLFTETTFESTRKIPFLGDLPFVGFVFRNDREQKRKTEVITFLTPKVIVKREEAK